LKQRRLYRGPLEDCFGNVIAVGDRFLYHAAGRTYVGLVIAFVGRCLLMDVGAGRSGRNSTVNVRSPHYGVCLDRVPEDIFNA